MSGVSLDLSGMPTDPAERAVAVLAGMAYSYAVELNVTTRGASGDALEGAARRATERFKSELRKVFPAPLLQAAVLAAAQGQRAEVPWDDLKVAYGVDDDRALWTAADAKQLCLPAGWALNATNGAGARAVAIFRVDHAPTLVEGRAVRAAIQPFCSGGA